MRHLLHTALDLVAELIDHAWVCAMTTVDDALYAVTMGRGEVEEIN